MSTTKKLPIVALPKDYPYLIQVFVADFQKQQPSDLDLPENEIKKLFSFENGTPTNITPSNNSEIRNLIGILMGSRLFNHPYTQYADPNVPVPSSSARLMYSVSWGVLHESLKATGMGSFIKTSICQKDSDVAKLPELLHYYLLCEFGHKMLLKSTENSSFSKEDSFALVSDPALYNAKGCKYDKGVGWKVRIIVSTKSEEAAYGPRNDFNSVSKFGPLILVEVVSDIKEEHDRIRLLLQATAACRLLSLSRKANSTNLNPLPVLAIYVNKDLVSEWYFVYKEKRTNDNNKVEIALFGKFDLKNPVEACRHLAYLHNYVECILPNILDALETKPIDNKASAVDYLTSSDAYKNMGSLSSKGKKKQK